ncbi:MAG: hypothetical protein ACKVLI_01550 [Alphaproteobacteria bacterium]|jgi:uncharacterized membrane protein YphA (DoxX/SURF4 family)
MESVTYDDIGLFIIRCGISYIYLHGSYMTGSSAFRREISIKRTSVLYKNTRVKKNYINFISYISFYIGLTLMTAGSLLILSGIYVKTGATMLILFTIPAIVIHRKEAFESLLLKNKILSDEKNKTNKDIETLALYSHVGQRSSGNKNYMLLAINFSLLFLEDPVGIISLLNLFFP